MKKALVILILLTVAGALGWHAYKARHPKDKAGDRQPVLVNVAPVERKDVPQRLKAVGTMVPYQSVAIRSRIDSQIDTVNFHGGDEVKQGDLLFTLDDRTLKAQIDQADSNLKRDQAQEDNLRVQYERVQSLNQKGFDTQSNLDQAKAAWDAQKATVAASQAALENLQVQLQYTQIKAPIGGRAGTVTLTAGNTVKANDTDPLVVINQVQPIWAQISVPQGDIARVRQAMAAGAVPAVAKHESGVTEEGRLDYLDNAVDETTGTIAARIVFDNAQEKLWPGMFVDVTLTLGVERQAVTVPEVAVQHGPDGAFVFVIAGGKAETRKVQVERVAAEGAVIASGLDGGEQVAVDGLMKLENGTAVKLAAQDGK